MYILDTSVLSVWVFGNSVALNGYISSLQSSNIVGTSVICAKEEIAGWMKEANALKPDNKRICIPLLRVKQFIDAIKDVPLYSYCEDSVDEFCAIRSSLKGKSSPIGNADMQIAAIAVHHGAVVLTFNAAHFSRCRGVQVQVPPR